MATAKRKTRKANQVIHLALSEKAAFVVLEAVEDELDERRITAKKEDILLEVKHEIEDQIRLEGDNE